MTQTKRTKQCKNLKILFSILHLLCVLGPFMYFIPYALSVGEPVEKISLTLVLAVAGCALILSLLMDIKHKQGLHKSIFWFLVIGVTICLNSIQTFVYILAVISILDELVFYKLKNRYSELYRTNKEIDRRG